MNGDYGATAAVRTLRDGLLQGFLSTANYENLGCAVCVERVGHHTAEACSIAVSWYFVTGFVTFVRLSWLNAACFSIHAVIRWTCHFRIGYGRRKYESKQ